MSRWIRVFACLAALACVPLALAQSQAEQLKALEIAYRNGILTREEYETKKQALLAAKAPAASANPAPRGGPPTGIERFKLVRVMDTEGWGQPVVALQLLIPSDWRPEGGVRWLQNQTGCAPNIIQVLWRASSPDGLTALEFLPQHTWQWADDPQMQSIIQQQAGNQLGCPLAPVMGAADFVRNMVLPQLRQGARVLGAEGLAAASRAEQQSVVAANQALLQGGYMRGVRADVSRVRVGYTAGGKDVEEWIQATVTTKAMPTASTASLMQGQLDYSANNYTLSGYNTFAIRAPRGELDAKAPLFATILGSIRINPQFQAAVGQFLASMAKINMRAAQDRHRIWQEAQQSIQETWRQTVQQREESQARIHEQFGQAIRGVETFVDTRSNERMELSSAYKNAWSNGKGEYLLTDNVNFDPRVTLQEDWTLMRREAPR